MHRFINRESLNIRMNKLPEVKDETYVNKQQTDIPLNIIS